MANDLIAALERAADFYTGKTPWDAAVMLTDAALIRNHIADLRNGGEWAKVVAYAHEQADCWATEGMNPQAAFALRDFAKAIASGAHMGGNDADDCPPTDPDAATGCADDQIWRDVPVEALRAALPTPPTDAKGDV